MYFTQISLNEGEIPFICCISITTTITDSIGKVNHQILFTLLLELMRSDLNTQ